MRAKTSEIVGRIRRVLAGEEYRNTVRLRSHYFTRSRKVGFVMLIAMILNMFRRSTQIELDDFREVFMTDQSKMTTYTKQSFSEARRSFLRLRSHC